MTGVLQPTPRPTPAVTIRRARPGDARAIARMLSLAFAAYRPLYTNEAYAATVLSEAQVLHRLAEGPVWVAVSANDAPCVATASALATAQGCYVRSMAVLPAARGQGLGWQLLEQVERFAREAGLSRLYLSTTPFLDRAIALYGRYGFRRSAEGPSALFGTPLFTMVKGFSDEA